ncbi:alpha 1,2-mannosyltransferase, partial [Lecanoromycetidae sp. Uapishka_2]
MIRPTRSIIVILVVFVLVSTVSYLDSRIQSWTHYRYSIISAPRHEPTAPPPRIVDFWEKWANVFDKAKPKIGKIELKWGASVEGSDKANGDRVPSPVSIGIPEKDVESLHQSHMKLVGHDDFKAINSQAQGLFSGVGVVIVGGGPYMPPALLSIRMLRKVNKLLPVHVFLPSKHDYESEICEQILPAMDAECFVIEDHLRKDNPVKVDHYQLKVLAILFSSFETVLYLDSDCMVLRDPMELIESEPFLSTGLLSWPDYWVATEDPVFYKIAGLKEFPKGVPARSSESGQLVLSKKKHLSSLLLAAYYNVYGPDYYYPMMSQGAVGQGDKETFLAAAVVTGNPFYRVKEKVGTIGYFDHSSQFHGGAMVQWHAADEYSTRNITDASKKTKPRPFFLHANVPKMNVARLLDENGIYMEGTEERIRIWGKEESTRAMFGYDVERFVWNEMRELACQLQDTMKDFHGRWQVCRRAQEHYREMFEPKTGGGVRT